MVVDTTAQCLRRLPRFRNSDCSGAFCRALERKGRCGTFLLLLTGVPLILAAKSILTLWLGPVYAIHGARVLRVLVVANMIWLSAIPYAMTLVGAGQQRLATVTPLLEGFSNLLASIVAGYMFGAVGVAMGTLFGALVGVAGNFVYAANRWACVWNL